jgi:NADH:ubiquinone oxidoreductase subunit 2 (subunit N)
MFLLCWVFFIKNNFFYIRMNASNVDILKNSKVLKKFNSQLLLNYSVVMLILFFISIFFQKGVVDSFWWNHLYITNFNHNILLFVLFISVVIHLIVVNININNNVNNIDYYFSILNISIAIPLIFLSNSLYNFIFVLEMISILIFYKFSVSKFWYRNPNDAWNKRNLMDRLVSRFYLNVLFYQYWVNFFSSVLIILSILNIMYSFGSTEWVFLNLINKINNTIFYFNSIESNFVLWIVLFFGLFFKIGISPIHLFKIEIYKGIPFISIFFYTTFYFTAYFIFFSILMYQHINSFKSFFILPVTLFVILGIIYVISLLFDTNFTKAFFAYSTIANSLSFICLLLSSL